MKRTTQLASACLLLTTLSVAVADGPVSVVPVDKLPEVRQPQAAIDDQGQVHIAYGSKNEIYCSTSADGGKSYSDPVLVGQVKNLSLGMRRGPRIAVADGTVVVSAIGGDLGGGKDGDLLAWRSVDHGKSWQGPVRVNDVAGSAREGLHAMAAGPNGELYCAWLDLRSKGTKIFGSSSSDGGATWTGNHLVYRSPSGSVCECCHPSVAFGEDGVLHVMWRNSIAGSRDIWATTSKDGGKQFSKARKLGSGTWRLDACPMDGGAIVAMAGGKAVTVWRRDKELFFTAGSKEISLGRGEQPWVATSGNEPIFVWISKRPGELWLKAGAKTSPQRLASGAFDPVIAGSALAKGPAVVCWESPEGDRRSIMAMRVDSD